MGGNAFDSRTMVFDLAVVETETTVVKRAITKSLARTTQTAAKKKKPAKKAAKKPAKKAKKAKKPKAKKKKKKKLRYPGGHRVKNAPKSKKWSAASKKTAAAQKKKGVGLFKPVSVSAALSAVTGIKGKTTRGQVFKALWVHIKKKGLNKGRNVGKIDGIFGGGSMFKLPGAVSKHIK